MSKYRTEAGIECTEEECKLIDSFKRIAKKWKKDGKRLWIYSASGTNVAADIWVEYTEPEQRSKLFNLINKEK